MILTVYMQKQDELGGIYSTCLAKRYLFVKNLISKYWYSIN